MATRRSLRRATTLVALCTVAVTGIALVPGVANADPRPTIASVERQLASLERDAAMATERYHQATEAADKVERRLARVRARVTRQEAKLAQAQQTLGRMAASTYRNGGVDAGLRLLLSDDPAGFLAQASAAERISVRQDAALHAAVELRQQLAQDRLAVAKRLGELEEIEQQLLAEKDLVDDKVAQSARLLESLREEERRRLEAARRAAAERAAREARAARDAIRSAPGDADPASDSESDSDSDSASDSPSDDAGSDDAGSGSGSDSGSQGSGSASGSSGSASGAAAIAVETALAQVGDAYVYGANGPDAFDCSGLTTYAWNAAGVSLPRSSSAQYAAGRKVSQSELQPGDLVYYYSPISHVGMYIGGGQIVHAANPRTGVNIASLDSMPYVGATRP